MGRELEKVRYMYLVRAMARGKHGLLLLMLLIKHLTSPLVPPGERGALFAFALIALVQFVGVNSVLREQRRFRLLFHLIFLASIGLFAASVSLDLPALLILSLIAITVVYMELIRVIVIDVLRPGRVDIDRIMGALAGYMLIAVVWTVPYLLLQAHDPNTFQFERDLSIQHLVVDAETGKETWAWRPDLTTEERILGLDDNFNYFSFVTLTTLGYGDIVPKSTFAQHLATLEAMVGTIYLAVLLARLVSLNTAQAGFLGSDEEGT